MANVEDDEEDRIFVSGVTDIPFKQPKHSKIICFDLNGVLISKE